MSISTAPVPPPPKKKSGLGCLGCGCLVLVLLVILFFGLVGAIFYSGYRTMLAMSSTTPTTIPSVTATDDQYQSARQKLADFDHDVVNHQAATVRFSADEINALLSRNPDMAKSQIHTLVSFTNDEARIQAAFPTDAISQGMLPGRYSSFDTSFEVHFDQVSKGVLLIPRKLQVEDNVILGGDDSANQRSAQNFMNILTPLLAQQLNTAIRKNPDGATLLDSAKSIEIQGGQFVIETR